MDMTPFEIRLLRARLGLSQTEAAALCGVQDRTWRRWEAGDRTPGPAQLEPAHALLARQDRAVREALALYARLSKASGAPDALELAWSPDEDEAAARGWPCANAWLAVLRRVAEAVPVPVRIIEP